MTISVTGKLNEAAKEFTNNSGVNFLIRLGVQVYDFKVKAKVWVNYSGFVFVGNQAQIDFYRSALVEGAIVELKGTDVIPEVYGDQNKVTLKVQDPKLGYIGMAGGQAPQQQQQAQQQGYQQQAPNQAPAFVEDDLESIPF